ncbi:hypothetical protein ACTPOK_42050 [Streptomyces inhibens]|uniref:hypothetical protein n=1 Tax=Streptomyces inhibens TaxID=2293571 RepID=UPI00402A96CE
MDDAVDAELEVLAAIADGARVVALGEGAHFVAEFGAVRRRLVGLLAERCGFTVMAFEFGFAEAPALDRWLQGYGPDEDLTRMTGTANSGFLPKLPQPEQPPRLWECRPPAFKTVAKETFVLDSSNLLNGLAEHGYRSVCVGGVTYFSRETPLGSVLPDMFDEDHWRPEFCSAERDSTRHQVDQALEVAGKYNGRSLYLFVNVSATHVPHGHYLGDSRDTLVSQRAALA